MSITLKINDGDNIVVSKGSVYIGGNRMYSTDTGQPIEIHIHGNVGQIKSDESVNVSGNVTGPIDAGGSVNCKDVSGNINAGGPVMCGNVGGSVDAGGPVSIRR